MLWNAIRQFLLSAAVFTSLVGCSSAPTIANRDSLYGNEDVVSLAERLQLSVVDPQVGRQAIQVSAFGSGVTESEHDVRTFVSPESDLAVFYMSDTGNQLLLLNSGIDHVVLGPLETVAIMNFVEDSARRSVQPSLLRQVLRVRTATTAEPILAGTDRQRQLVGEVAILDFTLEDESFTANILNSDDRSVAWSQTFSTSPE